MPKFEVTVVYMGEFKREVEASDYDAAEAEAQKLYDEGVRALPDMEVRRQIYVKRVDRDGSP